ncbi:hypothetical protein GSI_05028 [Ganoderma sinense ZZ0214-1]|uniref:CxC2-like cysteine cluster KDZ transposase-associated domain-containing protein n=1 Tax=Ganoderma sinense ZZ0214-1 TaxID=1077348 RepID=A0A2G8SGK3_9APHY|nr:hypothetical protein GSI_05028 [Ganoderma sinense ZZ0214-1]
MSGRRIPGLQSLRKEKRTPPSKVNDLGTEQAAGYEDFPLAHIKARIGWPDASSFLIMKGKASDPRPAAEPAPSSDGTDNIVGRYTIFDLEGIDNSLPVRRYTIAELAQRLLVLAIFETNSGAASTICIECLRMAIGERPCPHDHFPEDPRQAPKLVWPDKERAGARSATASPSVDSPVRSSQEYRRHSSAPSPSHTHHTVSSHSGHRSGFAAPSSLIPECPTGSSTVNWFPCAFSHRHSSSDSALRCNSSATLNTFEHPPPAAVPVSVERSLHIAMAMSGEPRGDEEETWSTISRTSQRSRSSTDRPSPSTSTAARSSTSTSTTRPSAIRPSASFSAGATQTGRQLRGANTGVQTSSASTTVRSVLHQPPVEEEEEDVQSFPQHPLVPIPPGANPIPVNSIHIDEENPAITSWYIVTTGSTVGVFDNLTVAQRAAQVSRGSWYRVSSRQAALDEFRRAVARSIVVVPGHDNLATGRRSLHPPGARHLPLNPLTHAKLERTFSRLLSTLSAMKSLRRCVSQKFAISDPDSEPEATCLAFEETHRDLHVNLTVDAVAKGRGRETKNFSLPTSPEKRVRSLSLPPIPVLEFTPIEDPTDVFDKHGLEHLYHAIDGEECLPGPASRERTAGQWDGKKFAKVLLKDLGLRIQLGHPVGEGCVNPTTAFNDEFVVLDITGIHEVGIDFCGCERAMTHYIQLLRQRWFPATSIDPNTAATMSLLEHFHLLSIQSKVSAMEYYNALSCRTDNSGVNSPKDRCQTFLLMVRQWRHLKILKRAGRGNDPAGVAATRPGECAVECPACPHPGKNMPSTDQYRPDESESKGVGSTVKRWLQTLYLVIDANFRQKRKKVSVSPTLTDPCLNNGSAFFVGEAGYKTQLTRCDRDTPKEDSEEVCNAHDAIKLANVKGFAVLGANSVATIDCSRHDMKRACSVGPLQHDKHVDIDYLLHSSLSLSGPKAAKVPYDVACICSPLVNTRSGDHRFPTLDNCDTTLHFNAHHECCRSMFFPHVLPEWGWTDRVVIERGWSWINALASSKKEMGSGSRRDLLDDVLNHWNWTKVITMSGTLLSRLKFALPNRETHVCAFEALTESLPKSYVAHWLQMVTAWEVDPRNSNIPNPYVAQRSHLSQNKIRVELAQEDSDEIQRKRVAPLHVEYTSSTLIVVGMELEDQQRRLRADLCGLGIHATSLQRAQFLERQNALQRRIDAWRSAQQIFMPFVASLFAESARVDGSLQTQSTPLYLPSAICARYDVSPTLLNHEWRLREAQAHDSLADLRGHLEVRAYMCNYEDTHVRGQRENTGLKTLMNSLQAMIDMDADRYRNAYISLGRLATRLGKIDWQGPLQRLDDSHIRHISADDGSGSVGAHQISWIWFAGGSMFVNRAEILNVDVNKNLRDSLRIEWCKARAQALRWMEECELLRQEMRRVADYHQWAARRWEDMVGRNFVDRDDYLEGADAYAHRQASLHCALKLRCLQVWRYVPEWMSMGSVGEGESMRETAVGTTIGGGDGSEGERGHAPEEIRISMVCNVLDTQENFDSEASVEGSR